MKNEPIRRVESHLGEAVWDAPIAYGEKTTRPAAVAEMLRDQIGDAAEERFVVLLLNQRKEVTGYAQVSQGTLTSSLVHPREVFGPALRMGAAAIIVAHNHPSGDPTPSEEDKLVTKRLIEAGRLLGVPLLDHVIIGADSEAGYVSLRDEMECF